MGGTIWAPGWRWQWCTALPDLAADACHTLDSVFCSPCAQLGYRTSSGAPASLFGQEPPRSAAQRAVIVEGNSYLVNSWDFGVLFFFFLQHLVLITVTKSLALDFPDDPVVKTLHSQCRGPGSVSDQGTRSHVPKLKIPSATTKTWSSQRNK